MPELRLHANHKLVRDYYASLKQYLLLHATHEGAVEHRRIADGFIRPKLFCTPADGLLGSLKTVLFIFTLAIGQ